MFKKKFQRFFLFKVFFLFLFYFLLFYSHSSWDGIYLRKKRSIRLYLEWEGEGDDMVCIERNTRVPNYGKKSWSSSIVRDEHHSLKKKNFIYTKIVSRLWHGPLSYPREKDASVSLLNRGNGPNCCCNMVTFLRSTKREKKKKKKKREN